ncbi:uncharacterized protein LOC119068196 [Bradysia coprophila]|uniref:uncharacterized protein LOC119068196 n=1 Tax=Bradysia coprophila TaxID=38358 RepID=UPI00187DA04E|nr:uncharacterized protein LOC119068196 [Bradysia coprophila]
MEDSGIDSGDVTNKHNSIECIESDDSTNNNLTVAFKEKHSKSNSINDDLNVIIKTNSGTTGKNKSSLNSSCRTLQRKLELKVERAKRNYSQLHDSYFEPKPNSSTLIPINRLQIPGCQEIVPLVEYKSANSDDDDDEDEIAYFPVKSKHNVKHDLSDTFSLQEMTIMGTESDDSESQTLEFLSPSVSHTNLDKFFGWICCANRF